VEYNESWDFIFNLRSDSILKREKIMFDYSVSKLFIFNSLLVLFTIIFGVLAGFFGLAISDWSLYRMIFVLFVMLLVPVCLVITGSINRALLVALILAIPFDFNLALFGTFSYQGKAQPAFVIYLYDFPLIGLVALWMWEVVITRKMSVPKSAILLPAIFWVIWSVFSIYNSGNLIASWVGILRMVKLCIFMMVVATLVRDKQDIHLSFITLFINVIIQSFVCIVQYLTGSFFGLFDLGVKYTGDLVRVPGTMGWPNTAGTFLAALTSMAIILYITKADKKLNTLSLVTILAGSIAIIATYSRGSWFAFFVALAIGIFISHARKWLNSGTILRFTLIVVALLAVLLIAFAAPFTQDIMLRLNQIESSPGVINDRISLNIIAENMILAHPLLGVGLNTFIDVMREYDTTGVSYRLAYPVHNAYLLIASETGLVGLGLFLIFTVTILSSYFRATKNMDRFTSVSAICLICGMVVILVSNTADVHLMSEQIFALFWLLAGLGIAFLGMKQPPERPQILAGTSQ
jgi:O-antigen ligase